MTGKRTDTLISTSAHTVREVSLKGNRGYEVYRTEYYRDADGKTRLEIVVTHRVWIIPGTGQDASTALRRARSAASFMNKGETHEV